MNANSIPAAIWAVLDIIRTEGLRGRVMAETEPCFTADSFDFDVSRLCSQPLLNSIYMEELRLRAAATVTRQIVTDDFHLGRWRFQKGANIFAMPWFGGRDETFWNTGKIDDPHAVSRFWAERFLEYPDDPASGPVRKHDQREIYQSAVPEKAGRLKTVEDDKNAKLVSTGLESHFFPFGGGPKICPGRFFAKQEIMATVAVLLRAYEMELIDPAAAENVGEDMARFPLGTLPPKGSIPFRIRRRRF